MSTQNDRLLDLFERLGIQCIEDCQFIKRDEIAQCRNVGIKTMLFLDQKMKDFGLTWGKYSIAYYLSNKDVLRGNAAPSDNAKIYDQLERLCDLLEGIKYELFRIANHTGV